MSKQETAQPLCGTRSNAACILVFDGTENPVGLLTNSASVSFAYKYDPWGVQTLTAGGIGNGAAQNPYAFHAGIKDPGSGLVKFGQRWYNPTTGTWTQQDTLDALLDPANANRYAYAGDDPINNLDPSGTYNTARGAAAFLAGLIGGAITGCIAGAVAGLFSAGILSGPACIAGLIGAGFAGALGATATDAILQLYGF